MTNIKAHERGRNLILDVGDEGEDGFLSITIRPINAKLGAALQALHAGIAFGESADLIGDAISMGKLSVGEENWSIVDGDDSTLRWAEAESVVHAGFFWNVQGGGIDLVNMVLNKELGGHPKALSTLMERNGLSQAFGLLTTLLDSVEAAEIPAPDGTSDTSTPAGSAT